VVLEVQIFGVLGSGEQATSGLFHFPIQLCFGCQNLPLTQKTDDAGVSVFYPDCEIYNVPLGGGATQTYGAFAFGHGPCCAAQDFVDYCIPCGEIGQPCCPDPVTGALSCDPTQTDISCTGSAAKSDTETCAQIPRQASATCAKNM